VLTTSALAAPPSKAQTDNVTSTLETLSAPALPKTRNPGHWAPHSIPSSLPSYAHWPLQRALTKGNPPLFSSDQLLSQKPFLFCSPGGLCIHWVVQDTKQHPFHIVPVVFTIIVLFLHNSNSPTNLHFVARKLACSHQLTRQVAMHGQRKVP